MILAYSIKHLPIKYFGSSLTTKIVTTITAFALALFSATNLYAANGKSNSLTNDAWQSFANNDYKQAKEAFLSAIKEENNNTRAYWGLSLLYSAQKKDKESWDAFSKALRIEPNFHPYAYAALHNMRKNWRYPDSGVLPLLEKLSAGADQSGVLKAMANEYFGHYYEEKGDLAKSNQYYRNYGAITDWTVIGPFENISASGFDQAYPPEREYDLSKTYQGKGAVPAKWFKIAAVRNDRWIDFTRYFAHKESVFYGNTFVYSPAKRTVQIRIGTSGSLRAFLNDEMIIESFDETNNDLDTFIVETELQEGWNRLLIKCGYSEIDMCNFLVRITDERGEPVKDLTVSTDAKSYKARPGAPRKTVENFAELFFKSKIKENPSHMENYILLASSYLLNDKATEAELTLREAIKLSPNCTLPYIHMLEAYARGEKFDEMASTVEKIFAIDKNNPFALEKKISEHLKNQEFDKAEELIKRLETATPESEQVYELYLGLYGAKQQYEKIIEQSKRAYAKYPDNWVFVYTEALVSVGTTRKYDGAIDLMEKYLKKRHNDLGLLNLAELHLTASNVKKWEETCNKLFELDPASTNRHYDMSGVYLSLQDYDKAEKRIKRAIELCPNSSVYWSRLGEIYRIKNQTALSKQAYQEALKFYPVDYDARRILRELEGKRPVFSLFEEANIESLIKSSPDAKAYPENGGVILLHDAKRAVYEQGASESSEELLVKVFNKNGIDAFKERLLDFNPYAEVLSVEKAVVVKSNGSEVKADVEQNHIVFKSLEENDVIHLKWSKKNYYSGILSQDFWDTQHFNSFYPIKKIRYSLLVPEGFKFRYAAQNMSKEPTVQKTPDGLIYQWSLNDEPAIDYEFAMPALEDAGKILYVSSIDDWESIVGWFSDLARTKTRSSFEIREQVESLFRGKENLSEEEKIETIYNFITENIQYSSVAFRQTAHIPQKARDVLVNKIGDCKDTATLCIAMLGEIGVKAHYVLVNTRDAGRNEHALPSVSFNHCIAAVETKTGLKYLDLTAYNYPLNSVPQLDSEAFSLLIKQGVKSPEYLPKEGFSARTATCNTIIETREDMGVFVRRKSTLTGASGALTRTYYRNKGAKEREKILTEALSGQFPSIKLVRLEAKGIDEIRPAVDFEYEFESPNYVVEAGQLKLFKIPWRDRFKNNEGLSHENRKFSFYYWPSSDKTIEEIEIKLPAGYEPVDLVKEVKLAGAVADYSLTFAFSDGTIKGKRVLINKKDVVSTEEYSEFKKFYNSVVKEDERQILLKQIEAKQ